MSFTRAIGLIEATIKAVLRGLIFNISGYKLNSMAKKKITIDGLARMVADGFNSVESKMATKSDMDNRFDKVESRLDRV